MSCPARSHREACAPGRERDGGGQRGRQGAGLFDDVAPVLDLQGLVAVNEAVALASRRAVLSALASSATASATRYAPAAMSCSPLWYPQPTPMDRSFAA